jgi:Family of unknown function (DUF6580)
MKINGRIILFLLILVALATICKFFFGPTSWSGFSPLIAIALFSGMIIKQKDFSFVLPLAAVFISDAIIQLLYEQGQFAYAGFYSGQWKNYLILLLPATLLGWLIKGKNYKGLLFNGIAAPTVFFLISNFNVWLGAQVSYTRDFNGLMNCYIAGLPFYRNALIGTLVFLPVILFLYNYLTRKKTALIVA